MTRPQHPDLSTLELEKERNPLLAAKVSIPRLRADVLARPGLTRALDEAAARELVLVCTPAGFGKTTLLSTWARATTRLVAWLSLDPEDNDPARFWRYITVAMAGTHPALGDSLSPLLAGPEAPTVESLISMLPRAVETLPTDLVLVLDDYHVIETQRLHEGLALLLSHPPDRMHLVVSSRADPQLPLARLRARGQLAELRLQDLRFTTDETLAFLSEVFGLDLPDSAATVLEDRIEGWAAGLQLAGLSLRSHPDPVGMIETLNGGHRYILDYLTEEVLETLSESVRSFLVETSVLERLSGPLCDAVTGRSGGQVMLEGIEEANLFLVPLDDVRGWWRYHHLFADLLRSRLQQQNPDRHAELHRRAASWHDAHGLPGDAVRHALAVKDPDWAARLIERHFDALYLASEGATLQRWLAALPSEVAATRPRLLLAQAGFALRAGVVDGVEEWLNTAEHELRSLAGEPFEPTAGRAASRLANVRAAIAVARAFIAQFRGDPASAVVLSRRALARLDDGEWLLGAVAKTILAVAEWLLGRLNAAERAFMSAISGPAAGETDIAALSTGHLGQIRCAQGRLDAAREIYRWALEPVSSDQPVTPAMGVAHVGLAELAYQRGELDTAGQHLAAGLPLCRRFAYAQAMANGLATLAWIRQEGGDVDSATSAMREANELADPVVADLLNPVPASRARLWLSQGNTTAAAQWAIERGLSADDEPSYPEEPAYLALARVLLAQNQPDRALGLLDRLHALAMSQDRVGSVIEIQALRALVLAASHDDDAAMNALTNSLTLAYAQGYVRVFADEGSKMAALLRQLSIGQRRGRAASPIAADYVNRILAAIGKSDDPDARDTIPETSLLTAREREVLGLMAAGMRNREIADELVVTLETVKKHVTHIFEKLDATNRTEAVARARALGLLA